MVYAATASLLELVLHRHAQGRMREYRGSGADVDANPLDRTRYKRRRRRAAIPTNGMCASHPEIHYMRVALYACVYVCQ